MDVASVDVIWNGFHQAKKIADLAETFEVNCAPHNYYSHLATFIAAQWCAAIPNARILEYDVDDVPWRDELVTALPEISAGRAPHPGRAGVGCRAERGRAPRAPLAAELASRASVRSALRRLRRGACLARRGPAGPCGRRRSVCRCGVSRARRVRALSLLPVLPPALRSPSRQVAVLPALALASLSILLSTISIVGIELTEVTIRLVVAVFVLAMAAATTMLRSRSADDRERSWSPRREALTIAVLAGLFVFSYASSLDIARPFLAEADLGHYLLYADEVEAQGRLLIDDPFAGEPDRIFADPQAVGAVYGTFLILDGITSWPLAHGLLVVSAISVLSVFAAAAALWGTGAGLAAAGAYAVAPIRLDPMYWHGLGYESRARLRAARRARARTDVPRARWPSRERSPRPVARRSGGRPLDEHHRRRCADPSRTARGRSALARRSPRIAGSGSLVVAGRDRATAGCRPRARGGPRCGRSGPPRRSGGRPRVAGRLPDLRPGLARPSGDPRLLLVGAPRARHGGDRRGSGVARAATRPRATGRRRARARLRRRQSAVANRVLVRVPTCRLLRRHRARSADRCRRGATAAGRPLDRRVRARARVHRPRLRRAAPASVG